MGKSFVILYIGNSHKSYQINIAILKEFPFKMAMFISYLLWEFPIYENYKGLLHEMVPALYILSAGSSDLI